MQAPVWKGRAERLTSEDFGAVAAASGVEAAALRAIWEVEAANKPFRTDGSVERRFEPHHFPALANQGWNWKRSLKVTAKDREAMFAAAYASQPEHALRATSFGGPQIMGFNADAAGYLSATDTRAWAALVVAGLVALAVARGIGRIRRADRLERENTDLREGAAADRRMDHADRSSGDSDADADWLRRWAERRQRQRGRRAP